jgi:TPR repeat protein
LRQKSGDACYFLAVAYLSGDLTGEQDAEHGAALLERACENEHANACRELADFYKEGVGVPMNELKAMTLSARYLELLRKQNQK